MNLQENILRVKQIMGILNETMIPNKNKTHNNVDNNYIVVAQDDLTNDLLLLFVELHKEKYGHIYSYFLQVFNEHGEPITKRLYRRDEALNYLPDEVKPLILPLVMEMTTELVNRIKPEIINRTSMEILNDNTLKRFNEITNLLQNELNYQLIWFNKDNEGKNVWRFKRGEDNVDLTEETIENFYIFNSDRLKNILFDAEKKTNILIKKNWLKDRSED